jgi:hypothetical protein
LGDVELDPGVDVHGRTVDENGVGIATTVGRDVANYDPADAERRPVFEQLNLQSESVVKSDADGAFVLEGLPPGELRLWAKNEETRMAWSEPIQLVEGVDVHGLLLTVPRPGPDELITGVVLCPDGQPAAQAFVSCAYFDEPRSGSTGVWAGDDGRFRVLIEPGCVRYDLTATDRDARYSSVTLRDVRPGDRDLELRISEQQPQFCVELRGPSGEPVDFCFMRLHSETAPRLWRSKEIVPELLGRGRHELAVPTTRFRLEVNVEGCRTYRTEELDPPLPGSTLEIRLERASRLRGRVFFEGKPAARVDLSSFKDRSEESLEVGGFRSLHTSRRESEVVDPSPMAPSSCLAAAMAPTGSAPRLRVLLPSSSVPWLPGIPRHLCSNSSAAESSKASSFCPTAPTPKARSSASPAATASRARNVQALAAAFVSRISRPVRGKCSRAMRTSIPISGSGWTSRQRRPDAIGWNCEVRDGRTTRFDLDLSRP